MLPYIDIHTHHINKNRNIFSVLNFIIGKEDNIDGFFTAGIHPWYIDNNINTLFQELEKKVSEDHILGIGECGLDKLTPTNWEKQVEVFIHQINLANQIKKPLILHCVKAYQEILHLLKQHKISVPVVFHGFNKNKQLAESILKNGYYLSFGTYILNGKYDELLKTIDLTKIFFETDNKSTNVVDIYAYFCAVRNMSELSIKEQILENFKNVFKYSILQ